jgi:hypothetical protein
VLDSIGASLISFALFSARSLDARRRLSGFITFRRVRSQASGQIVGEDYGESQFARDEPQRAMTIGFPRGMECSARHRCQKQTLGGLRREWSAALWAAGLFGGFV